MLHLIKHKFRLNYFSGKLNQEVKEVYWQTIIAGLALSLVFIFEPIYLYSLGYSINKILLFYAQVYGWYAILASFGAMFAGRFGYKHAIFVSNIFYVLYWGSLLLLQSQPAIFFVAPALFALQKSWFWPAFHADMAISSKGKQRSREVGVLYALIEIAFIIGPVIGGFVSQSFGFGVLFGLASFLMLVSVFPLFLSPEIYTHHRFRFRNLLRVFRRHTSNFFGYWGYAEDLMVMSLWPIFIFLVVPNFSEIGILVTIATLLATVIMLYVGRLSDHVDKRQILKYNAFFYSLTWIFRFFAKGLGGVFVFDALTRLGKDVVHVPEVAISYEAASSRGPDHAIAYTVFQEISLSIGKILMALISILILAYTSDIMVVFVFAGMMTMLYGFIKAR